MLEGLCFWKMWKLNGCLFPYLTSNTKYVSVINILNINYDCYVEILKYLPSLEDKLNFGRVHTQFFDVVSQHLRSHSAKINVKMLTTIDDWRYLMKMCGDVIVDCTIRHSAFDEGFTVPFIKLLCDYCKNLRHVHLIFVDDTFERELLPAENRKILQALRKLHCMRSFILTDAKAPQIKQLRHFTELEYLNIDAIDIDLKEEDFLPVFHSMNKLKILILYFESNFFVSQYVAQLPALCPLLEELTLNNFDVVLPELGDFTNLKSLCLISSWNLPIHTEFYCTLVPIYTERLELLELRRIELELDHIKQIVKLKNLKAFSSDWWPDFAFKYLTEFTQLKCLSLVGHYAETNSAQLLLVVGGCAELQHLKLGKWWQIDNDFIQALLKLLGKRTSDAPTLHLQLSHPVFGSKLSKLSERRLLRLNWKDKYACQYCTLDETNDREHDRGIPYD